MPAKDLSYQAKFKANENSVSFDANGGTGTMNPVIGETNQTITLPSNSFTNTGYTFIGWSTTKTGAVEYLDKASYLVGANATYTLYALWGATITFDCKGGSSIEPLVLELGVLIIEPVEPEKSGYAFSGWYTSQDEGTTLDSKWIFAEQTVSMDITLYAKWNILYNIAYVLDGGSLPAGTPLVYLESELPLTLAIPEKDGYNFIGWYASYSFEGEAIEIIAESDLGNKVYYANWQQYTASGLTYKLKSDGTYEVQKYTGEEENVVIPEKYLNKYVTSIGNSAFIDCTSLKSVVVSKNVKAIVYSAFLGCTSLTDISLPEGLSSLEQMVFDGCSSLTSIVIPFGVTVLPYGLFAGYSSLTNVVLQSGIITVERHAFYDCSSLTSIKLLSGVTSIGDYAFSGCSALVSVELPEGLTSIGNGVFKNCELVSEIILPSSLSSIGEGAFENCSSLTSIAIPNDITILNKEVFANCNKLESVVLPSSLKK